MIVSVTHNLEFNLLFHGFEFSSVFVCHSTCSRQVPVNGNQHGTCRTFPPSRQLDKHTFPFHHTADSLILQGKQKDQAGKTTQTKEILKLKNKRKKNTEERKKKKGKWA